jgi:Protein of unknown function (DUF2505)
VAEQLDFTWVYNTSPLAIFRMATRLDHLEEKARYLGHERHSVLELRERDGLFRSVTERQVDVAFPGWALRLYTPRNMIKQTQTWQPPSWDGGRRYDSVVEVSGVPVRIFGGGELIPVGFGDTRYTISLTITSPARFLGRRIEAVVAGALQRAIDGEHQFRLLWLDRRVHDSSF